MIYFIRDEGRPNHIKIGRASNPLQRLADLQGANPNKLTLLTSLHLPDSWERRLHKHFSKIRVRGEWFEGTAELYANIAMLETRGRLLCR